MKAPESSSGTGETASGWSPEAEALLQNWHRRVYAAQSAYYLEAERFRYRHYLLGIAVIVMSTIIGSSILADKSAGLSIPNVAIGALGSLAAILASLQTFLKPGESAARNALAADWYSAIRRDIEELQALPRDLRGDVRVRLDTIRNSMNKAGQNAPELGEHRWGNVAQRFGVDEPPLREEGPEPRRDRSTSKTRER